MGEVRAKIKVSQLKTLEWHEVETLVDTGANYTTVPGKLLDSIGVERTGKILLEFGDGRRSERATGFVFIEVEGKIAPNVVVFAEANDAVVLGLVTLESCGLMVDPVNRKLEALPVIHHYFEIDSRLRGNDR